MPSNADFNVESEGDGGSGHREQGPSEDDHSRSIISGACGSHIAALDAETQMSITRMLS